MSVHLPQASLVALRKESVDRNPDLCGRIGRKGFVALRKESVDRNIDLTGMRFGRLVGRSPQGERG